MMILRLICVANIIIISFAACSRIHTTVSYVDSPSQYSETISDPFDDPEVVSSCVWQDNSNAMCSFIAKRHCNSTKVRTFNQTKVVKRKASVGIQLVDFLGGAAALGAGIGFVADAPKVAASDDPVYENPVGREGAYGIGIGLIAAGVALGVMGTVNAVRAKDTEEPPKLISEPRDTKQTVCASGPFINENIDVNVSGNSIGSFPTTDDGRLQLDIRRIFNRDIRLKSGDVVDVDLIWQGKALEKLDVTAYYIASCNEEANGFTDSKTLETYKPYLYRCKNALKHPSARSTWWKIAEWYVNAVEVRCSEIKENEDYDRCLKIVNEMSALLPKNSTATKVHKEYIVAHKEHYKIVNTPAAEQLLKHGNKLYKKAKFKEARDVASECLKLVEDYSKCEILYNRADAAQKKSDAIETERENRKYERNIAANDVPSHGIGMLNNGAHFSIELEEAKVLKNTLVAIYKVHSAVVIPFYISGHANAGHDILELLFNQKMQELARNYNWLKKIEISIITHFARTDRYGNEIGTEKELVAKASTSANSLRKVNLDRASQIMLFHGYAATAAWLQKFTTDFYVHSSYR